MKLSKYLEDSHFYSGKVSDITRQLAFAGIAVVWVFKQEGKLVPIIPNPMLKPLALLVLALGADFLQYFILALIWYLFYHYHEKRKKEEDPDLPPHSLWYIRPSGFLWFLKSCAVVSAYILLLKYFFSIWVAPLP